MNCTICGISVFKKPLYRNNPKGVIPADWRCEDDLDEDAPKRDKTLIDITKVFYEKEPIRDV
jgi:hypothetical protein